MLKALYTPRGYTSSLCHAIALPCSPPRVSLGVQARGRIRGGGRMDVLALYGLLVLTTLPPLVPNSALLISAGVLASRGELFLPQVLLVVAGSALLGDLLMYLAARRFGEPVRSWMRRHPRRRALLEWTSQRIQRYGVPFVIAVRFLPSGRIAGALASGVLRYPRHKYALGAGIAELTWAT